MDRTTAQLPQTTEQRVYAGLFLLFVVTVFIGVMAFEQHLADAQFITRDELKRNTQELESYSAEASLISKNTLAKTAPRPYVEAYSASLLEATNSISQKLREHPHSKAVDHDLRHCLVLADRLTGYLNELATVPRSQLGDSPAQLHSLSGQFQKIEESL